jgi:hypothetical protein
MAGCRVSDLDPATVPGYMEALTALTASEFGTWMDVEKLGQLTAFVMGVSRPYVQAELLADVSDYLAEQQHHDLAGLLDNLSAGIRRAIYGV